MFVDAERTNGSHFASEKEWCAAAGDRCAVHQLGPATGSATCLAYHGTRDKAWAADIEAWRCRLPNGIEARFGGKTRELAQFQKVMDAAFATAPTVASVSISGAPNSTPR